MARFLVNLGYRWGRGAPADGVIFNASGFHKAQAGRRDFESSPDRQWLLFDPQLYLSVLDLDRCGNTCARLSTYPWFGIDVPEYDSRELNQADWFAKIRDNLAWVPAIPTDPSDIRAVVKGCLDYQVGFGVTHLIAPTPLATNADDQFGVQIDWLDQAAALKDNYEQPILATVALHDYLLSPYRPADSPLLQTILDNIMVSGLDGAYALVVQEDSDNARITEKNIAESLLYISHVVGKMGGRPAVINFADDLGLACCGTGGTAFAGGATMKQRRMCLSDFIERSGGGALPRFYSNTLIGDYYTESDLDKLRAARLTRLLRLDVTPQSEALIRALDSGSGARELPAWRQTNNNVGVAQEHRMTLLHLRAAALEQVPVEDRPDSILAWLQNAEAHSSFLEKRFLLTPLSENGRHIAAWRGATEELLDTV
ncbi:MAG: hypothetical protein Q8P50_16335 [Bacillota bacterium]|nr:hypothetical protein [Bacillota bacterium]